MTNAASITELSTPHASRTLTLMGNKLMFHATSADTNGRWSLIEYTCAPRFAGPPAHIHDTFDEAFYVLEGTLAMTLDGAEVSAGAGQFVRVPAGAPHAFSNPSDAPARFLVFCSPGGFEGYFLQLGALIAKSPIWPPADPTELAAISARYDQRPAPR